MTLPRRSASQRFHAAPRSRPVAWLIGGIAACFALVVSSILLGGAPGDDGLEARIGALESKAAQLPPAEAIKVYEELLSIAKGERWAVKAIECRALIRSLKAELVLIAEAKARLAAWATKAELAAPAAARPLIEEGYRLKDAYPRVWTHDALLDRLLTRLPPMIDGWQEKNRKIIEAYGLERRGEADWRGALLEWRSYLALELPQADRDGAAGALRTLEIRAREEVVSLLKKAAAPEKLKKHRLRFEGTAAAAELEKAIAGR